MSGYPCPFYALSVEQPRTAPRQGRVGRLARLSPGQPSRKRRSVSGGRGRTRVLQGRDCYQYSRHCDCDLSVVAAGCEPDRSTTADCCRWCGAADRQGGSTTPGATTFGHAAVLVERHVHEARNVNAMQLATGHLPIADRTPFEQLVLVQNEGGKQVTNLTGHDHRQRLCHRDHDGVAVWHSIVGSAGPAIVVACAKVDSRIAHHVEWARNRLGDAGSELFKCDVCPVPP